MSITTKKAKEIEKQIIDIYRRLVRVKIYSLLFITESTITTRLKIKALDFKSFNENLSNLGDLIAMEYLVIELSEDDEFSEAVIKGIRSAEENIAVLSEGIKPKTIDESIQELLNTNDNV